MPGPRMYELVIRNLTSRRFKLQGPTQAGKRKIAEGRLLLVRAVVEPSSAPAAALPGAVGPALVPDSRIEVAPSAVARFSSDSKRGDALEFVMAFVDSEGEGFAVRAHANQSSPLRSDVLPSGLGLQVTSQLEEVPRFAVSPPEGYADAMGVYPKPARCEAECLGKLRSGDEVLAGAAARQGRWLQLTWPIQGWVQAETRAGEQLLRELPVSGGCRQHLRQVISVRPAVAPAAALLDDGGPREVCLHTAVQDGYSRPPPQDRTAEQQFCEPRAAEVARLERTRGLLERGLCLGSHRAALRGVF